MNSENDFPPPAYETTFDDARLRTMPDPVSYARARRDLIESGWQREISPSSGVVTYVLRIPRSNHDFHDPSYALGLKDALTPITESSGKIYAHYASLDHGDILIKLPEALFMQHVKPYMPKHHNVARWEDSAAATQARTKRPANATTPPTPAVVNFLSERVEHDLLLPKQADWKACHVKGKAGFSLQITGRSSHKGYVDAVYTFLNTHFPPSAYGEPAIETLSDEDGKNAIITVKIPAASYADLQRLATPYRAAHSHFTR